jgi:hypothetical protein
MYLLEAKYSLAHTLLHPFARIPQSFNFKHKQKQTTKQDFVGGKEKIHRPPLK